MTAVTERSSIDRIVRQQAEALHGFRVMAIDGEAGQVAGDQDRIDDRHLLVRVDGGFLGLFHQDVVIELDAVDEIDAANGLVHVDRVADWVQQSPKVSQWQEDHSTGARQDRSATLEPAPAAPAAPDGSTRQQPTADLPPAGAL